MTLYESPEALVERFRALAVGELPGPSYNVAPSQPITVVRADGDGRRLEALAWGLAPAWAKRPLINLRAGAVLLLPARAGVGGGGGE